MYITNQTIVHIVRCCNLKLYTFAVCRYKRRLDNKGDRRTRQQPTSGYQDHVQKLVRQGALGLKLIYIHTKSCFKTFCALLNVLMTNE